METGSPELQTNVPVQQHDTMTTGPGVEVASRPASEVTALTPQGAPRGLLAPAGAALPLWLWPAAICLALLGLGTANPMLTTASVLAVPVMVSLLWRPGEPPILLALCLMQWLQTVTPVFDADLAGNSLEVASGLATHGQATWLSLGGVVAIAVGMRLALKHRLGSGALQMEREFGELNPARLFLGYLAGFGVSAVCGTVAWHLGGLAQLILAVGSLKWAVLWLLMSCVLAQGRGYGFVVAALLLETSIGFLGYFATFKEAFFVLAIALFSVRRRLSPTARIGLGGSVIVLLATMIFWQSVKKEYRYFVSGGETDQVVRVSVEARVEKLGQLLAGLDAAAILNGLETLIERMGYTELFAATLAWVPANEPFTGGELWKGAVLHPLMPRLLFPNKEVLNDSERARRFSGLTLSGSEDGTSIGIGIMAESYADFGPTLMFVPLLLLGYVFGRVYRAFSASSAALVWGAALAVGVFFTTMRGVEISGVKLLGGMLTAGLVMYALNRFFGRGILKFLRGGKPTGGAAQRWEAARPDPLGANH